MAQGKCSLLKPVDSLTGTFFVFSQYAQDLTKQYSNPDSYRCVPSKFVAMNLDYTKVSTGQDNIDTKGSAAVLGEIFQNYFENACTFLRGKYFDSENQTDSWNPEYTRTLLFQTLEKYKFLTYESTVDDTSATTNGSQSDTYGAVSAISKNIQYIGDINIYSYDDTVGGVGYNEIYCYIPNEAKCVDYQLQAVPFEQAYTYPFSYICGYEGQSSYNNLTWLVDDKSSNKSYIDNDGAINCYGIGKYTIGSYNTATLVPLCLEDNGSDDKSRTTNIGTEEEPKYVDVDKFDVNTILVLYDIVRKDDDGGQVTVYKNVPLGIYFTGCLDENLVMSNTVVKYVNSELVYNQGTSYGLRVCTRFLSTPNSTEPIEVNATGSSNVSMMAPVLEKMGETLMAVEDILDDKDAMYQMIKDHLAQFKNNKVNVPYVRQLGNKKYWFVNGKNTGAIAQYEYADPEDIIAKAIQEILANVYSKSQIVDIMQNYVTINEFNDTLQKFTTKLYVDQQIAALEKKLLIYLQGTEEREDPVTDE